MKRTAGYIWMLTISTLIVLIMVMMQSSFYWGYMVKESPIVMLLDMIMTPGIDGLETYRRIIAKHPGQKAIISSGFSATDRIRKAQALGAGRYLRKPYSIRTLGLGIKKTLLL